MVETEKEFHKKAKPGGEVWIGTDPLRGVCQTK
jgi:hypothetical protein